MPTTRKQHDTIATQILHFEQVKSKSSSVDDWMELLVKHTIYFLRFQLFRT